MPNRSFIDAVGGLKVWVGGGKRAPHKPLLILLALGELSRGNKDLKFADIDVRLTELLKEFGPPRSSYHSEYPFWRLQKDGIWCVQTSREVLPRKSNTDAKKSELLKAHAIGRFSDSVLDEVKASPELIAQAAGLLLVENFPGSIHDDILGAVGLDFKEYPTTIGRRRRDPLFRSRVLTAYGYKCAICGFDVRLRNQTIGLDSAHIKWHAAGGSEEVTNGVAMCTLHHKLFDLGAYTIDEQRRVLVSEHANGTRLLQQVLLDFHGQGISETVRSDDAPGIGNLRWHRKQVFKDDARPPNLRA